MATCRKVPFLTFVLSPHRKVKVNLSGCNFECRGCFAVAKEEVGRELTVERLLDLIERACSLFYGGMAGDVQMTGGEPTMDRVYLSSLIAGLRTLGAARIGISTNGHALDCGYVEEWKSLGVGYVKLDVKAYTEEVHREYTGRSNANVLRAVELLRDYELNFYVRTILTPGIIGLEEIEKIARFVGGADRNIPYKIYQFAPEQLDGHISRSPTQDEMLRAYSIAGRYLDNAEFYTTETAYKPDPYRHAEVRADELMERFRKIDEVSRSVVSGWNMESFTMNQVLEPGGLSTLSPGAPRSRRRSGA